MIAFTKPVYKQKDSAPAWSEGFLSMLPAIRRRAHRVFASLHADTREEAVAECIAHAMIAYAALFARGKVDLAYPTVLARYAAAQVRRGQRVGSPFRSGDVFARFAQRRHGFSLEPLDRFDKDAGEWIEATVDDTRTPVPEQAAFRIDFPAWLATQTPRNRRIAKTLALGYSTGAAAKQFRISAGRVSQLRRMFDDSWQAFHGHNAAGDSATTAAPSNHELTPTQGV
jgi:hypothetical protein